MRLEPNKTKHTARAGEWDRQADCWPTTGTTFETFSIGIFQWVPAANGMKKAKSVKRIRGHRNNPQEALDRANAIVAELNASCANTPVRDEAKPRSL